MQKIKKFYLELSKDEEFKVKLKDFTNKNGNNYKKVIEKLILPQAQKMGYNFTKQDLLSYEKENIPNNLSDDDLLNIAGGKGRLSKAFNLAMLIISIANPSAGLTGTSNVQQTNADRLSYTYNSAAPKPGPNKNATTNPVGKVQKKGDNVITTQIDQQST